MKKLHQNKNNNNNTNKKYIYIYIYIYTYIHICISHNYKNNTSCKYRLILELIYHLEYVVNNKRRFIYKTNALVQYIHIY